MSFCSLQQIRRVKVLQMTLSLVRTHERNLGMSCKKTVVTGNRIEHAVRCSQAKADKLDTNQI